MVPQVASCVHRYVAVESLYHNNLLHRRPLGPCVSALLQVNRLAAAVVAVGRDQHLCPSIDHPITQRIGTECGEDDAMRGTDAGTGLHGNNCLGDHWKIDPDPVTFLHPEPFKNVG